MKILVVTFKKLFLKNSLFLTKFLKKYLINFALIYSQRTVVETKGWDVFRDPPPKIDSGSMANQRCLEITVQITKAAVYLLVFIIVLGSGVATKLSVLFMTSQLRASKTLVYCNRDLGNLLYSQISHFIIEFL